MSSAALELRNQLVNYLAGEIDYDQLDEWISANTWNIRKQDDSEASELAYAVEAKMAEYSGDYISEERLRENLRPFVTQYKTTVASVGSVPEVVGSSDTTWLMAGYQIGKAVVDTSIAGALA